jgi:ABC-type antimicrobial peptide transport system permease subunit
VGLGRFYDWDDMREARRVAFLGSDAAKQLFPGRNPVGENVYLNDFPFVVIGVMAKKKQDSSYDGWDVNKIFIPFSAMRRDFPDKPPGTSDYIRSTAGNAEIGGAARSLQARSARRAGAHAPLRSQR